MPLAGFVCPDGGKCDTNVCLQQGGCRMGKRCASRSYLQLAAGERPWTGVPSTTQLLKGTMEAYLQITHEYWIKPQSRAKCIHGTVGHKTLETSTDECSTLELALNGFFCGACGKGIDFPHAPAFCPYCGAPDVQHVDVTGIADVLEREDGVNTLMDNKFVGSYRMARALGLYGKRRATGTQYKSGARMGMPRVRTEVERDRTKRDIKEWMLQLNRYRRLLNQRGIPVHRMQVQCFVRDAGTWVAEQRGITQDMYLLDVPILPDELVDRYFAQKRDDLLLALKRKRWDTPCSMSECWDGLKCKRFCDVWEHCPQGRHMRGKREPVVVACDPASDAPIAVKTGRRLAWMSR